MRGQTPSTPPFDSFLAMCSHTDLTGVLHADRLEMKTAASRARHQSNPSRTSSLVADSKPGPFAMSSPKGHFFLAALGEVSAPSFQALVSMKVGGLSSAIWGVSP